MKDLHLHIVIGAISDIHDSGFTNSTENHLFFHVALLQKRMMCFAHCSNCKPPPLIWRACPIHMQKIIPATYNAILQCLLKVTNNTQDLIFNYNLWGAGLFFPHSPMYSPLLPSFSNVKPFTSLILQCIALYFPHSPM